jgi:cysteine synthase A
MTTHTLAPRAEGVLDTIGRTPLVPLQHVVPAGAARVLVKLESMNPTGSMKDRMALAMIEGAERSGRLAAGRTVTEFTGGSTGTSLAFVCAAKKYPAHLVSSDAFSLEKRNHMRAMGAKLTIVPSQGGNITPDLFVRMREMTDKIQEQEHAFWTDQFNNEDQARGYYTLADEVWEQTGGQVDAFVHVVGTAGSLRGCVMGLRRHNPKLNVTAVEPSTSAVISGGAPGAHRIEGIGIGRLVPHWSPSLADQVDSVSTEDAEAMARRLAKEEAIFAGTSTGANVVAAIRAAQRLGAGKTLVTLVVDTGLKYISTELYR